MRAVVQKVTKSSVKVEGKVIGKIEKGLNVLIGITEGDTIQDIEYLKNKILNLRIFEDEEGKLNKSLKDVNGELLLISQFTLYGDCRKGRRPSFIEALSGDKAEKIYNKFVELCKEEIENVQTGEFGAHMDVEIQNDGPVTLLIDSKKVF
ncbi:D-aminoacyl-tRNA deacylase [Clostridium felsineum]|uniref:D-aminoacyl-tRNA deacylase n=1 Tax=Clostridium felsineum TaxID=36839 RepID=A0A1S8MHY4_9CLOT|nr:D-aminoacyl-tRNA deacylase [Clostridium felsineum]URZ07138.1 D-aminoacyl-tRNA deacylase [Clostridium felsineum]URZ12168.1 D-aminoacyl-tRNA deacylase [Clostridium felsineum]